MGIEELEKDPEYGDNVRRNFHGEKIQSVLDLIFPKKTSKEWLAALNDADILATEVVDGTDVEQVLDTTRRAVAAARDGQGPNFIESRTSRWPGNYASSPTLSLSGATQLTWTWAPETAPEPVRRWVERSDPLLLFSRRLLESGAVTRDDLLQTDVDVRAEMRGAVEFAQASPEPSPEEAAQFVLAPARN